MNRNHNNDTLTHYKYTRKEWKNGRWVYYYEDQQDIPGPVEFYADVAGGLGDAVRSAAFQARFAKFRDKGRVFIKELLAQINK